MDLDRTKPEPLYEQIQAWMREKILDGSWPEHYKLPAENDLAEEMGVNRGTLRKAVGELIDEGLLVRVHGKGTFVASQRLEQPLAESFVTFSEGLIGRGIPFRTTVIAQTVCVPDPTTASLLNLTKGAWAFYLERVRFIHEKPIILLRNHVVYERCPGIEHLDFTHERLFDVLERQYNLPIDWGQRTFEAQLATPEVAAHLGMAEGDAIMYVEQVSYLKSSLPVELSNLWIRGDHFRLSAQVQRNRATDGLRELLVGLEGG
jgi:DNA-binding GntR family transcriptional regulator